MHFSKANVTLFCKIFSDPLYQNHFYERELDANVPKPEVQLFIYIYWNFDEYENEYFDYIYFTINNLTFYLTF